MDGIYEWQLNFFFSYVLHKIEVNHLVHQTSYLYTFERILMQPLQPSKNMWSGSDSFGQCEKLSITHSTLSSGSTSINFLHFSTFYSTQIENGFFTLSSLKWWGSKIGSKGGWKVLEARSLDWTLTRIRIVKSIINMINFLVIIPIPLEFFFFFLKRI